MSPLTVDRYYSELCSNIRATDEISLKVLGFVPLTSGAGIITLLSVQKELAFPAAAVVLVAVFAAVVTLALYRWERRNIQLCIWLMNCAADVERAMVEASNGSGQRAEPERSFGFREGTLHTQFLGRPPPPPFLLWPRFGKTQAAFVLYGITIVAWLAVVPITLLT